MVEWYPKTKKRSTAIAAIVLILNAHTAPAESVLDLVLSNANTNLSQFDQLGSAGNFFSNIAMNEEANGIGLSADGSIQIELDRGLAPLLAETVSGDVISRSYQELTGKLGNLNSLVLGASLNNASSIDLRFSARTQFPDKVGTFDGNSANIRTIAVNTAKNRMQLDGSIAVSGNGYALEVNDVSTNVIGAASGGKIQIEMSLP